MDDSLGTILAAAVESEGFSLYHWTLKPSGRRRILRIFLHSAAGVGLDDCARVSRRLGAVLEEAQSIQGSYILEVSSPGLDRPLVAPWHYETAVGERVRIVQRLEAEGQRSLEGLLLGVEDGELRIDLGGSEERLSLASVSRAQVVPEISLRRERHDESDGGMS